MKYCAKHLPVSPSYWLTLQYAEKSQQCGRCPKLTVTVQLDQALISNSNIQGILNGLYFDGSVNRPSEFIMFADSEANGDVLNPNFYNEGQFQSSLKYSDSGALMRGPVAFRHNKKSSTVYADGHVKLISPVYGNYTRNKMYFEHQD